MRLVEVTAVLEDGEPARWWEVAAYGGRAEDDDRGGRFFLLDDDRHEYRRHQYESERHQPSRPGERVSASCRVRRTVRGTVTTAAAPCRWVVGWPRPWAWRATRIATTSWPAPVVRTPGGIMGHGDGRYRERCGAPRVDTARPIVPALAGWA